MKRSGRLQLRLRTVRRRTAVGLKARSALESRSAALNVNRYRDSLLLLEVDEEVGESFGVLRVVEFRQDRHRHVDVFVVSRDDLPDEVLLDRLPLQTRV